MTTAVMVDQTDLPEVTWEDPLRGNVHWKTLISSDVTATKSLVCGLGIMQTGDTFALHSHPQAEICFGIDGEVDVQENGTAHRLKAGSTLFIPGHAVHGVLHADQPVRWFYAFAADSFADIPYTFA